MRPAAAVHLDTEVHNCDTNRPCNVPRKEHDGLVHGLRICIVLEVLQVNFRCLDVLEVLEVLEVRQLRRLTLEVLD